MTADQRFERDLPDLLAQLAPGPTPDYRDHVVQQTARMRQRPGWTFPERWLPMSAVTSRMAALPRVPVRFAPMVALILLVLALVAVAAIGSRPRGPAPFGHAENGLVAYAAGGHIYTLDPATGAATALTADPGTDSAPVFSRNGERILFQRALNGSSSLVTVRPDGSDPIAVTPVAWSEIATYEYLAGRPPDRVRVRTG